MEQKTKIHAENGQQDLVVTREFDLPLELLWRAYTEAEFLEQWMGTKVLKLESRKYGSYEFETRDPKGNIGYRGIGVIHEFIPQSKMIRTSEMENGPFGVQLEVYDFEKLTDDTSKLTLHIIYESGELRDKMLALPFAQGVNWAHRRLEEVLSKLKTNSHEKVK